MQPIAIVTAFVAALYIFGRGSLVFDPRGTLAFYRRVIYSTHGRIRLLGAARRKQTPKVTRKSTAPQNRRPGSRDSGHCNGPVGATASMTAEATSKTPKSVTATAIEDLRFVLPIVS